MKMGDAIKEAIKLTRTTQVKLAERMSRPGREVKQSALSERLSYQNISVNLVLEMLDELDYELVIQPVKRGKRPEGQILITRGDAE